MLEKGQIIKLNDNKEYMVVNVMELHSISYVYLITTTKPIDIVIATQKVIDGKISLQEIKNNEELDYVLSKLVSTTDIDD